uniref:Uncharacterized protein n=3 Tax=unclassified bacterial viruses TaxID=12333 RepID=A0AAU6W0N0_9VIRU
MSKPLSAQARIAAAEKGREKYLNEMREMQEDNIKRLKVLNKIDEFADRVTAKFVQVMTRFDDYIETKKSTVKAEIAEAEAYLDGEVK